LRCGVFYDLLVDRILREKLGVGDFEGMGLFDERREEEQHFLCGGAVGGFLREQSADEGVKSGRVAAGQGLGLLGHDLPSETDQIVAVKWRRETGHMIQHTPRRPDVRLVVVGLLSDQLWTQVERSPNPRVLRHSRIRHYLRDAEIADLRGGEV
jgi:hypothetical protein